MKTLQYSFAQIEAFATIAETGSLSQAAIRLAKDRTTLRDLLAITPGENAVNIADVEPASELFKRFDTAAMSIGALSPEAHEALAKAMNGKGNVAILLGDLANESTRDRTKGVEEVVAKYPNIKIVQKQTAKFTRNDAVDVVSNWMTSGEDIQAIASNNDEMAIGALQALGKNPNHILIAGVDGTPDALQMLKSGKMIATIFQDAKGQGEGAVDAAIKLANGEKVEKIIDVPYQLITKENMAEFTNRNQK